MREEIIVNKTQQKCFNITASKIDSLRINSNLETSVRVYDNGCIGVAGKVGNCDVEALKKEAREALAQGIAYPDLPNEGKQQSVDTYRQLIPEEELLPTLNKLLARLSAENPDFLFSNKIILEETEKTYSSTDGSAYSYRGNTMEFSIVIKYKGSANIMDEDYSAEIDAYDEDKVAADVKLICENYLKTIPSVEEDKLPVLVDMSVLQYLLSDFHADYYALGMSRYKGKIGEKIFSDKLSILCDRSPARQYNIPFFDGEGVVNEDYSFYLVKNGVMKGIVGSKKTAKNYGMPVSGTGGAEDYASVPIPFFAGVTVLPTAKSLEELVGGRKTIFVSVTSGGDVTPDGTVSLPVMSAYLIENGSIVGRLPELTVTGNFADLFGDDFIGAFKGGLFSTSTTPYLVFEAKLVNKA